MESGFIVFLRFFFGGIGFFGIVFFDFGVFKVGLSRSILLFCVVSKLSRLRFVGDGWEIYILVWVYSGELRFFS